MLRKILKTAAVGGVVLVVAGVVLYQFFGLRLVLDGGGVPRPRFVESAGAQAERVERHRAAQRAETPTAEPGVPAERVEPTPVAEGVRESAERPAPPFEGAPYWTDFRGPLRDGAYRERPVTTNWPASGLTPVWKQPSGGGYASFVIARGRAFTIEQRGAREVVAAYALVTGRELWTNAWPADFREALGGDGPRATPTWADGVVYALGAEGELRALEETMGRVLWRTNILEDSRADNLPWGMSGAPLVVDEKVVVLPGGPNSQSVAAYDRRTGRRAWASLGDQQAYASPMLATLAGVRQILVVSATRITGVAVENGALLWEYPWVGYNGINAAQPLLLGDNRVFVSSGYGLGAAVLELSSSAGRFSVREVWRNSRMKNRFASSVLHEGVIYGLDESIMAAVDAATGELKWKGGRYGYGQLLLADGHLIVLSEDGDLALVRANPARHEEMTRFHALEGKTWNVPALAGGYLIVRNLAEMAAFDLRR
jgi:outer membrane protein assembly factor BamB